MDKRIERFGVWCLGFGVLIHRIENKQKNNSKPQTPNPKLFKEYPHCLVKPLIIR